MCCAARQVTNTTQHGCIMTEPGAQPLSLSAGSRLFSTFNISFISATLGRLKLALLQHCVGCFCTAQLAALCGAHAWSKQYANQLAKCCKEVNSKTLVAYLVYQRLLLATGRAC
jgi:hypothetical protein